MQYSKFQQQFIAKFLSLLMTFFILIGYAQTSPEIGKEVTPAVDSRNIFVNFPWLSSIIDVNNCANNKATVYYNRQYYFVWVETSTSKTLYFQDGTPYCEESPKEECLKKHQLKEVELTWHCGDVQNSIGKSSTK